MTLLTQTDLFSDENVNPKMPIFPKTTPFRDDNESAGANVTPNDKTNSLFDGLFTIFTPDASGTTTGNGGELTGTEMNLNLLQGTIFTYGGASDHVKIRYAHYLVRTIVTKLKIGKVIMKNLMIRKELFQYHIKKD